MEELASSENINTMNNDTHNVTANICDNVIDLIKEKQQQQKQQQKQQDDVHHEKNKKQKLCSDQHEQIVEEEEVQVVEKKVVEEESNNLEKFNSDFKYYNEVEGDLLNKASEETGAFIAHQCNCVSIGSRGLATAIFKNYPNTNTYIKRKFGKAKSTPGTCDIISPVINMYAQRNPGNKLSATESLGMRYKWFKQCLDDIEKNESVKSVAFPYEIGCGLAGGNWKIVLSLINEFSYRMKLENRSVYIVKLPPQKLKAFKKNYKLK